jgi:uncharacterized protein DUF4167
MRNGQHQHHNKRMRGRNNNNNNRGSKGHNPLTRVYESNGPDVKIRGTANHVAEKYMQLARDAQSSGDPISAENYYQHAEHYFRLIAAANEQFRQPGQQFYQRPEGADQARGEDGYEDGEGDGPQPIGTSGEAGFTPSEPQPYLPRDAQPFPPRDQHYQPREHRPYEARPPQPNFQPPIQGGEQGTVDRLPAFITGGAPQQPQGQPQNGFDNQPDRFPLHRRRRRHRGPRGDMPAGHQGAGDQSDDPGPRSGSE